MDTSTINQQELNKLPCLNLAAFHNNRLHLQDSSGNGCAGDPPGYPTYFTRCVYTTTGNSPRPGVPHLTILERVVDDGRLHYEKIREILHRLWVPLPLDHERTRLWILSTYTHFHHCYEDVNRPEFNRPGTLIFPVPAYELKQFTDDQEWSEEYRAAKKAEVDAFNKMETDRAEIIAVPENHKAVKLIQRFYPDYRPEVDLIENPPKQHVGDWWETEETQPTEEKCASTQRWGKKHPFNVTWCQWCGRHYGEQNAK